MNIYILHQNNTIERLVIHKVKKKKLIKLFYNISNNLKIAIIIILFAIIYVLVYLSGGSHTSFAHLVYIPIMLSSYFWKVKGGAISALVAGILFGPLMPLTISPLVHQKVGNWIIRLTIFLLFGLAVSFFLNKIEKLDETMHLKDSISPLTGFYNQNALFKYLYKK